MHRFSLDPIANIYTSVKPLTLGSMREFRAKIHLDNHRLCTLLTPTSLLDTGQRNPPQTPITYATNFPYQYAHVIFPFFPPVSRVYGFIRGTNGPLHKLHTGFLKARRVLYTLKFLVRGLSRGRLAVFTWSASAKTPDSTVHSYAVALESLQRQAKLHDNTC